MTILLGLTVGSRLAADAFLTAETIGILAIGLVAFAVGTATGVLMGKAMHRLSGGQVNPLIGAAGVSAVPMAARVVNKVGLESNPNNHLLMHAMGPNVAGVIGSAVAAGSCSRCWGRPERGNRPRASGGEGGFGVGQAADVPARSVHPVHLGRIWCGLKPRRLCSGG